MKDMLCNKPLYGISMQPQERTAEEQLYVSKLLSSETTNNHLHLIT